MLNLQDFDFALPDAQIARFPVSPRDSSRLLVASRNTEHREHRIFHDLLQVLKPGDTLVLNTTRVLKARLFGKNAKDRLFEVLLLHPLSQANRWRCLVRPGKHIEDLGTCIRFPGGFEAQVQRSYEEPRQFEIQFPQTSQTSFLSWLDEHGSMPLPPYLKRQAEASDNETYQTVYAEKPESVAAPTAGLHFTPELIERLKKAGVGIETLHLQIGYGTFSPVEPEATELHSEFYEIPPSTQDRLATARKQGRRVIAVGTTSLRALEASADGALSGSTRLFIRPGYVFRSVDGLITNFHLPQSSLFILICAFMGTDRAQAAYREAVAKGYRFFSYGDAMVILP